MKDVTAKPSLFLFAVNTDLNRGDELVYVQEKFKGYTVKQFEGCYKGEVETSYGVFFIHTTQTDEVNNILLPLMRFHRQESFLAVNTERRVAIVDAESNYSVHTGIGTLVGVNLHTAQQHEGYTRDPATDNCWVVK